MNPIFVREIRQAVRNRTLLVLLCGYLVVLLLTIFFELVWEADIMRDQAGLKLFNSLALVVGPGTLAVVLLHTIIRCVVDRVNEDPLFFALITPGQIVRGRMYCSFVLSAIAYSVVLPFLTLAYLLRGLDLQLLLWALLTGFWWTQVLNLIALAFFIGVRSWLGALLQAVPYLLISVSFGWFAYMNWYFLTEFWSNNRGVEWEAFSTFPVIFGLFLPSIAYTLARAQMIPPSGDRMFAVRLNLTIWMPLLIVAGAAHTLYFDTGDMFSGIVATLFYLFIGGILFPILGFIILGERDAYPLRQRQGIPKNILLRRLYFPLSSGVVNGLFWFLLLGVIWILGVVILASLPEGRKPDGFAIPFGIFILFVFNYAATTRLARELIFRRFPLRLLWTVALVAVVAVLLLTILSFLTNFLKESGSIPIPFSPWPMGDHQQISPTSAYPYSSLQAACAVLWAVPLIIFGVLLLRNRFKHFRRPVETEIKPVGAEAEEIAEKTGENDGFVE